MKDFPCIQCYSVGAGESHTVKIFPCIQYYIVGAGGSHTGKDFPCIQYYSVGAGGSHTGKDFPCIQYYESILLGSLPSVNTIMFCLYASQVLALLKLTRHPYSLNTESQQRTDKDVKRIFLINVETKNVNEVDS